MLINSWKGFFSMGSSFLGLVTGLTVLSISFFIPTLETKLLFFISFSDLLSLISPEFDLVMLSGVSLLTYI